MIICESVLRQIAVKCSVSDLALGDIGLISESFVASLKYKLKGFWMCITRQSDQYLKSVLISSNIMQDAEQKNINRDIDNKTWDHSEIYKFD